MIRTIRNFFGLGATKRSMAFYLAIHSRIATTNGKVQFAIDLHEDKLINDKQLKQLLSFLETEAKEQT